MTYTCSLCDATKTEVIPVDKNAHSYGVDHICTVCGVYDPAFFDFSGNYYIATNRDSGNYFWMTNDTSTGTRYTAVDSGLTELPSEITSDVDAAKVWTLEKQEDGTLTDYVFSEKLWEEQLTSLLGTEAISGRTFAVLGEELVAITRHLPEGLEPEALRGLGTGSIARFEAGCFDGTDIRFSGSACLDADGFYYCYVADLSADVSYADGVYTLSNFHLDSN